ncbi:MAG: CBS domain-containing protein [Nitrosopumilus sp.]
MTSILKKPITIDKSSSLYDVILKLLKHNISRLIVTDDNSPVGIVTEKDLGIFLLTDDTERKLDEISLSEIIKKIISVDKNTEIDRCAEMMLKNKIGSLVITSNDDVVGILTKTELVQYFANKYSGKKIVGEYMSPYYAWHYFDVPLYEVVLKMINEQISRIILRDHDETPVGIFTFRDLLKLVLNLGEQEDVLDNSDPMISVIFPRKGFISESGFGSSIKINEIMSKNIVSVNYDDDLAKTGKTLLDKNINGAVVLSAHGTIIGVISKTDIIKALAFLK